MSIYTKYKKLFFPGKIDVSRFKGVYTTLGDLQAAYPTAPVGSYAQVDSGVPGNFVNYIYDNGWVASPATGTGAQNTDQLPEGGTNLYFTEARVQNAYTLVNTELNWVNDLAVYSAKRLLISSDATMSGINQRKFKIANGSDTWADLDYFLGNVNNTSDANKPVSIAQQQALDFKANLASPTFTGTVLAPIIGGSASSAGTLTLQSTSHATKGNILFGASVYDEVNNRFRLVTTASSSRLDLGVVGGFTGLGYSVLRFTDLGGGQDYGFEFKQESAVNGNLSLCAILANVSNQVILFERSTQNVSIGSTSAAGYKLNVAGTSKFTAAVTAASALARAMYVNPTLTAAANNDVLVALDLASTFTIGAFTGVQKWLIRSTSTGQLMNIGSVPTIDSYIGLFLNVTPNSNNYSIVNDGSGNTFVNGSASVYVSVLGVNYARFVSNQIQFTATDGLVCNNVGNDKKITFNRTGGNAFSFEHDATQFYLRDNTASRIAWLVKNNGNIILGGSTDAGYKFDVIGTSKFTASVTASSALARAMYVNPTLTAAANNDVLVGLDIAPTFTNGAFTGVRNFAIRAAGDVIPAANYTRSLGAADFIWNTAYINVGYFDNIYQQTSGNGLQFRNNGATVHAKFFDSGNWVFQSGGTFTDIPSARLAVNSTTQGFLPPRMTATEGSAISSPAEGLLIYVTNTNGTFTTKGWWGYNGAAWQAL